MLAYRSAAQESTGESPAMMMLGREVTLPVDVIFSQPPSDEGSDKGDHSEQLRDRLRDVHERARNKLELAAEKQAKIMYTCEICNKTEDRAQDLEDHLQNMHDTEFTLTCKRCKYESGGRPEMSRHYTRLHTNHRGEVRYLTFKTASKSYMEKKRDEKRRKDQKEEDEKRTWERRERERKDQERKKEEEREEERRKRREEKRLKRKRKEDEEEEARRQAKAEEETKKKKKQEEIVTETAPTLTVMTDYEYEEKLEELKTPSPSKDVRKVCKKTRKDEEYSLVSEEESSNDEPERPMISKPVPEPAQKKNEIDINLQVRVPELGVTRVTKVEVYTKTYIQVFGESKLHEERRSVHYIADPVEE